MVCDGWTGRCEVKIDGYIVFCADARTYSYPAAKTYVYVCMHCSAATRMPDRPSALLCSALLPKFRRGPNAPVGWSLGERTPPGRIASRSCLRARYVHPNYTRSNTSHCPYIHLLLWSSNCFGNHVHCSTCLQRNPGSFPRPREDLHSHDSIPPHHSFNTLLRRQDRDNRDAERAVSTLGPYSHTMSLSFLY